MPALVIYGIKNCDTMKKTFKWLDGRNVDYQFHDYKKSGVDKGVLVAAIRDHGWESVINKRGTTWRKLSKEVQGSINDENAVSIALENASIIKRPLLVFNGITYLGFNEGEYLQII